jgi:hypothetical protein
VEVLVVDPFGLGFDPQSVHQVSAALVPYLVEGARSLGGQLWSRAEDAAVDGAAGWGRRLMARLWGGRDAAPAAVVAAVDDVVADPDDEELQTVLRVQVRKALSGSPQLLAEIAGLLGQAQQATVSGDGSVAGPVTGSNVSAGSRSTGSVSNGWAIAGDNNQVSGDTRP